LALLVGCTGYAVGYDQAITVNTVLASITIAVRLTRRRSLARIAMVVLSVVAEKTGRTILIVFALDSAESALFDWLFTEVGQAISTCLTGLTNR